MKIKNTKELFNRISNLEELQKEEYNPYRQKNIERLRERILLLKRK